jgi:uncharacterized protein DUF6785/uncharacterized protein DUF6784
MQPRDSQADTPSSTTAAAPPERTAPESAPRERRTLWRAFLVGLVGTALVDLWIHYAELVLGGSRGHSALANTSIPLGAFNALCALVAGNLVLQRLGRRWALAPAEMLVIYVMMTTATVLSSSGGMHFIVPTIAAPFYFASPENGWAQLLHPHIRPWIAQQNEDALRGFYRGGEPVPVAAWVLPMLVWVGFLVLLTFTTLCLVALVRRPWVERERLTFPTVVLPLALIQEDESFLHNRLLWIGAALPFTVGIFNNLHLNFPSVPQFDVRAVDMSPYFPDPPWSAIGSFPISFYPFVIGIAYLLSLEVTFSAWFFYLVTRFENVLGAITGWHEAGAGGAQSVFPYLGQQGAGAFIALAGLSLWLARRHLGEAVRAALRGARGGEDREEPLPYRWAVGGLVAGFAGLVLFGVAAGMRGWVAVLFFGLALTYMLAATRIRAETGNAWLFGPDVDANRLLTSTLGTAIYRPGDLVAMAFLRSVSSFDLRCLSMPHQLDAFKMADRTGLRPRRLVAPILGAIVVGGVVSFWIALAIWYHFGALAKTDSWRTLQGRVPFNLAAGYLQTPLKPDTPGSLAVAAGALITLLLSLGRMRLGWWPLHPVGYAMANTYTMSSTWVPFLIAWLCKLLVLRYGGMRLYRRSLPFFLGLILGDFLNGGFWTLLGCFAPINVYPINW